MIPAQLKEYKNWIVWKLEDKDGRKIKAPYSTRGGYAKTNDPSTWDAYDACAALAATGQFNGVGFVFTNTPFVGVDLDYKGEGEPVFDGESLTPWAREIVETLDSYTERSQSKNGIHVILKGKIPPGGYRKKQVEMYDANSPRYFALTGDTGQRTEINEDRGGLARVHAKWIANGTRPVGPEPEALGQWSTVDVDALVARVMASPEGRLFSALYVSGETRPGKSSSESDMTMACILAKFSRDAALIEAVMRSSALVRPKWSEARPKGTIIQLVIQAAFKVTPERRHVDVHESVQCVAEILKNGLPQPPPVVVPNLAWQGRVTLLAAREGIGKSTLLAEAAAAVVRGGMFLRTLPTPQGSVLWVLVEESVSDFVRRAEWFAEGQGLERLFFLDRPVEPLNDLKAAVDKLKPSLVIIDTLHAFAGVEHASQADEWQVMMDGFRGIASSENGPAVLLAAQANKSTGDYRDSTAIGHGVDVVISMKKFENEGPDGPTRELNVYKRRFPVDKTTYQMEGGQGGQFGRLVAIGATQVEERASSQQLAIDRVSLARYILALGPNASITGSGNPRAGHPPFGMSRPRVQAAIAMLVSQGVLTGNSTAWKIDPMAMNEYPELTLTTHPEPSATHPVQSVRTSSD